MKEHEDVRAVATHLVARLGPTLIAALSGSSNRRISYDWAQGKGLGPGDPAVPRLLLAQRVWDVVSDAEGDNVARLWFIGANPWLGDVTPIGAIRELRVDEVMNAARAMAEDQFLA